MAKKVVKTNVSPRWAKFCGWLLRKMGWKSVGGPMKEAKAIVLGVPHTTVWDFLVSYLFYTLTGALSGYSILTFSDYVIKVVSSISPAHEETIDDLLLSHGVDTVDLIMKFSWIPKYPVTFAKKYYTHLRNPLNGPLAEIRSGLKRQMR